MKHVFEKLLVWLWVVLPSVAAIVLFAGASTTTHDFLIYNGVTDGSSAAAGKVGEVISAAYPSGGAGLVVTATTTNVTSISLTAGDWDVEANVNFLGTTATLGGSSAGISTTSLTLPTDGTEIYSAAITTLLTATDSIIVPRKAVNVSSTTTVYLVAKQTFTAGTVKVFGSLTARRIR